MVLYGNPDFDRIMRYSVLEVSEECRGTLFKEYLCPSESPLALCSCKAESVIVGLRTLEKVSNKGRQSQHILPIGRKKYHPKQKGSEKNVRTEFQRVKGGNPHKGFHRQI